MVASFDPKTYEDEVLKPLRRRAGALPDDLPLLYAIEPSMTGVQIEERLRKVRGVWNQRAGGVTATAKICQQLLSADDQRKRELGARMHDPAWWQQQANQRDAAAGVTRKVLADDLQASYGGLGVVTREQAEAVGRHVGLDRAQVTAAVRAAGLREVAAVTLPSASAVTRAEIRTLSRQLSLCGAPSVVHLLHPTLDTGNGRTFRLASGFAVPVDPGLRLDPALLNRRIREAETSADSPAVRARKEALGLIRTIHTARGTELSAIALAVLVDELRTKHADGLPPAMLVSAARKVGLDTDDAALLVASLLATDDVAPAKRGAESVRDLLAEGRLREAAVTLTALPPGAEGVADVAKQVADAENRVTQLLIVASNALSTSREDDAERALADAASLARDDEALAARLAALPPPPPSALASRTAGSTVELGWQAPSTGRRHLRYRVVRAAGQPPAHADDGHRVAETDGTSARDDTAPPGTPVCYAVFAGADGKTWSRACAADPIVLRPPVADLTVRSRADQVRLEWTAHSAATVTVARTTVGGAADPPVRVTATGSGYVDTAVLLGRTYRYTVTAAYPRPGGGEVAAETVTVTAAPREPAIPIHDLTVDAVAAEDGPRTRLTWSAIGSGQPDAMIRSAATFPIWEAGTSVTTEATTRYGREVTGLRARVADRMELQADVSAGRTVYVPFTPADGGYLVGRPAEFTLIEPVRRLRARRTADRVVVSWVWPDQAGVALVRWTSTTPAENGDQRISHSQYLAESGCVLPAGSGDLAVEVIAETGGVQGAASPPVRTTVGARPILLAYAVDRPPGLWGLAARRRRVVTLTSPEPCSGLTFVVIAAPGTVMPLRPDRGVTLARHAGISLGAGDRFSVEVTVPDTIPRPYWLRCFVLEPDGAALLDPPVDSLKVT